VSLNLALASGGLAGGAGLFAAWWLGGLVFQLALAALLVVLAYSPLFKRYGVVGNVAVALVASLPLIYGAAAAGVWRVGVVPFGLAAVLHFAREVVKDLEDVAGDRAAVPPRRTLPIVAGEHVAFIVAAAALIAFIPMALAPWFARLYSWRYGALAALAGAGAAALIVQLLHRRLEGVSVALKGLMVLGLAALLWDRL
jgi:geranylgeranylglycerol-phosphate geranylgeranyltransferase